MFHGGHGSVHSSAVEAARVPSKIFGAKSPEPAGRSLRRRKRASALFMLLFLCTAQLILEAVEIEVDHWSREQRQHLANDESAHHGVAKRLAELRARTRFQHQRQATQQQWPGGSADQ